MQSVPTRHYEKKKKEKKGDSTAMQIIAMKENPKFKSTLATRTNPLYKVKNGSGRAVGSQYILYT